MYRHELYFEAETSKEYASNTCRTLTGRCNPTYDVDMEDLKEKAVEAIPEAVSLHLADMGRELGASWKLLTVLNPHAEVIERSTSRQFRDYTVIRNYAKLKISATIIFESDQPVTASPSITFPLTLLLKFILGVIIVYLVVEAVKTWLMSMTTRKWKIQEVEYDEEGKVVRKKTSEGEAPDPLGMVVFGIFMLIMVIVLLFWFVGRPKKRKKK